MKWVIIGLIVATFAVTVVFTYALLVAVGEQDEATERRLRAIQDDGRWW